jgi:PPOX class probable F420-dependent enzyme
MLNAAENARLEEFLAPSRIAIVSTIGRDGAPQLTPNWYRFDDGTLTISTLRERVKYRNLTRDSRLAVCIYSEPLAQDYVTVGGQAQIIEDDSIWPLTRAIVARYVPADRVEARMRQLRTENRVIISMAPERALFRA